MASNSELFHPSGQGLEIIKDKEGRYSLNAIWKAAGSPENKGPSQWLRLPDAEGWLEYYFETHTVGKSHSIKTKEGKGGGTFAIEDIALRYAQYLSYKFALQVQNAWKRQRDEEANPELAVERAVGYWLKRGRSIEWAKVRIGSLFSRHELTDAMKAGGITIGWQYGQCTNEIYVRTIGGKASEIRKAMGLSKNANIRDNLSHTSLSVLAFTEHATAENIKKYDLRGFDQIRNECIRNGQLAHDFLGKLLR